MPQLSRDFNERKALIRGLINALIRNESIETTEPKAKAIKGLIDKLISKTKKGGLHNFRLVESFLGDAVNTEKLAKEIAPSLKNRSSGYTKITRIGTRKGDNAMIVRIEFSDAISKIQPTQKVEEPKPEKPAKAPIQSSKPKKAISKAKE